MNYSGTYNKIKGRLIPTNKAQNPLFIRNRKKETNKKPKQFLLEKKGSKYVYVSSLFPTTEVDRFKFDNRQIVFDYKITDDKVIISNC